MFRSGVHGFSHARRQYLGCGSAYVRSCAGALVRPANRHGLQSKALPAAQLGRLAMTSDQLTQQLDLRSSADILRRVLLGPGSHDRSRDINNRVDAEQELLAQSTDAEDEYRLRDERRHPDTFFGDTSVLLSVDMIYYQIRACLAPEDYVRILVTALRTEEGTAIIELPHIQRLISSRISKLEINRQLQAFNVFLHRFETGDLKVHYHIALAGLIAACTAHVLPAMSRWLPVLAKTAFNYNRILQENDARAILAAIKLGITGASSPNRHDLVELMYGSGDNYDGAQGSLRAWLPIDSADILNTWVDILAECGASEKIRDEWMLVQNKAETLGTQESRDMVLEAAATFIKAFSKVGHFTEALQIFRTHGENMPYKDMSLWTALLYGLPDQNPQIRMLPGALRQELTEGLLEALSLELDQLEEHLGLKWVDAQSDPTNAGFGDLYSGERHTFAVESEHRFPWWHLVKDESGLGS